jgi:malate permease and related proteins
MYPMTHLLPVLTDVIGPVLLIAAAGYLLGRARAVDTRALTSLAANILVPALAFWALSTSVLPRAAIVQLAAYACAQFLLIGVVVVAAARVFRWDRTLVTGLLLATLFSNAGNAGMPLAFFAWGAAGLSAAAGFFAISAVATNLLAAYLAARATGNAGAAFRALLRLPVTYAILAGLAVYFLGATIPAPIAKATRLLADGGIAVMLLLVGAQMSTVRLDGGWHGIAFATAVRLLLAPVVAWGTADLFGLEGVVRQAGILQASLPAAVTAAIWASEFHAAPSLVSGAVVVTTLLSPLTITPLLVFLR